MSSKGVASEGGGELVPSGAHGLGPWWFVVAVPSAEACDDPGDEGEGLRRMRVLLAGGVAFELSGDDLDDVISEAVAIDPQNGGPSAATLFAGMQAFVYWRAAGRLRLHVERPFATHIVSWLQSRSESLSGSS